MTIEVDVRGSGPAVVFLHGCPTTPDVLAAIAGRVASSSTAVQVHLPGYGGSSPLPRPWTVTDLCSALEVTLLARGIRQAAFVGFSGGAYLALALACRGAIVPRCVVSLGGLLAVTAEERAMMHGFSSVVLTGAELRPMAGPRFLSPGFRARYPSRVEEVERWMDATTRENVAAELDAFADAEDLTERVRAVTIPIVARVGAEDVAAPPAKSGAIARAAKRGELQIVPGVGHALTIEDAEGTALAVIHALGVPGAGG